MILFGKIYNPDNVTQEIIPTKTKAPDTKKDKSRMSKKELILSNNPAAAAGISETMTFSNSVIINALTIKPNSPNRYI